ncbi:MAG: hypothetical protein HYV55_01290 [Parcubacteria group bacterium]|nr:hypothetical protein [Parcubacteria group bacterium]
MKILKLEVLYVFAALLVGGILGFFTNKVLLSPISPAYTQECVSKGGEVIRVVEKQSPCPAVSKEKLAIPTSVLTNTTIGNWRASVEGSVTAKTDTTITVENEGNKVTVTFFAPITKIYASTAGAPVEIALKDIKLQSLVHITLAFPTENERKAIGIPEDVEVLARDILVTKQ